MRNEAILEVKNLSKHYMIRKGRWSFLRESKDLILKAVDRISFNIKRGEVFGLAGESGSGKTTTGKILALLENPTHGNIIFEGVDLASLRGHQLKMFRRKVQMIFQDPYESLDPRLKVYDAVYEPLGIHHIGSSKKERIKIICDALDHVELRLPEDFLDRYPHELSGGQRQRVSIARAIVLRPEFVIADEPVSMVDTSVRAGILNLMMRLKDEMNVTYLFITHDLAIARYMTERIAIMYRGRIQELGPTKEVIGNPMHHYTKVLLSSVPVPDPEYNRPRIKVSSEFWDPTYTYTGCRFNPRCPYSGEKCRMEEPELQEIHPGHWVACHSP